MLDERFWQHRLKSTSLAAATGALATGGLFLYRLYAMGELRWDLLSVLLVMAATKLTAMLYFHFRN